MIAPNPQEESAARIATEVQIEAFDPQSASDADWRALNQFGNQMLAESLPDDPPPTLEDTIAQYRNIPAFIAAHIWVAWAGTRTEVVARALLFLPLMEENRHLGQGEVQVLPAWRRQGWGRLLLARVVAAAEQTHRRLLIGMTQSTVPAGAAFMARLGGSVGLEAHTNQLALAQVDPALLRGWITQAVARNPASALGLWEGPYPETDLPAIAELREAMNHAPHGDLDVEDFHFTPEQLRQEEAARFGRGHERWTMYVRETGAGTLAGYTEIFLNPSKPTIVEQGATAVWPQYRGRGLGRWLKAAMLEKALHERPQARFVRTGNADTNAAMLKINHELGFTPYRAESLWQVPVTTARAYLG